MRFHTRFMCILIRPTLHGMVHLFLLLHVSHLNIFSHDLHFPSFKDWPVWGIQEPLVQQKNAPKLFDIIYKYIYNYSYIYIYAYKPVPWTFGCFMCEWVFHLGGQYYDPIGFMVSWIYWLSLLILWCHGVYGFMDLSNYKYIYIYIICSLLYRCVEQMHGCVEQMHDILSKYTMTESSDEQGFP